MNNMVKRLADLNDEKREDLKCRVLALFQEAERMVKKPKAQKMQSAKVISMDGYRRKQRETEEPSHDYSN